MSVFAGPEIVNDSVALSLDVPECVESLTTKGEYLTHSEILAEMNTEAWDLYFPH